jgi:hypothetical protein
MWSQTRSKILEPDAHPKKHSLAKSEDGVCIMRTQRQFRNLDSNARLLLLQQAKKRQGSMKKFANVDHHSWLHRTA